MLDQVNIDTIKSIAVSQIDGAIRMLEQKVDSESNPVLLVGYRDQLNNYRDAKALAEKGVDQLVALGLINKAGGIKQ